MKTVKIIVKLMLGVINITCGLILLKPIINLIFGLILLMLGSILFIASTIELSINAEQDDIIKT